MDLRFFPARGRIKGKCLMPRRRAHVWDFWRTMKEKNHFFLTPDLLIRMIAVIPEEPGEVKVNLPLLRRLKKIFPLYLLTFGLISPDQEMRKRIKEEKIITGFT